MAHSVVEPFVNVSESTSRAMRSLRRQPRIPPTTGMSYPFTFSKRRAGPS